MKKLLVLVSALFLLSGFARADLRSTDNLKRYESNLDTLRDKEGSLSQLIGELQGFDVLRSTCGGAGSVIVDGSILAGDTVLKAVVQSSANIVIASTNTTYGVNAYWGGRSAVVTLQSKIAGEMGNNIAVTFIQETSSNAFGGALTVVTTGYSIDVHLSSAGIFNVPTSTGMAGFASGANVCSAIRANAGANDLVSCSVDFSTNQVVASPVAQMNGGQGSSLAQNVIQGSYFTCADGKISISANAPVSANDVLILYVYKRPE